VTEPKKENAVGGEHRAALEEPATEKNMATAATEFKGMPEQHVELAERVLGRLRVRIATAMAKLGRDAENPRWIEAQIRLGGKFRSVQVMEDATDEMIEQEVADAIALIDDNFRPSFYEAWAHNIGIPEFAYVDVFEQLGLIPLPPRKRRS
jgi:hypothetical protein